MTATASNASDNSLRTVDESGWSVSHAAFTPADVHSLVGELEPHFAQASARGGVRNALDIDVVAALARSPAMRAVAESVLGLRCAAVRGLLFDKSSDANWAVAWHQDLTIAVHRRHEVPGFGPWSIKAGVPHVQAPREVLDQMLSLRVHLDDCGADHGPLRVLPGSHGHGKLQTDQIAAWQARGVATQCLMRAGDILTFRPLLLHASPSANRPLRRRVIHVEFAAAEALPHPFQWRWRV